MAAESRQQGQRCGWTQQQSGAEMGLRAGQAYVAECRERMGGREEAPGIQSTFEVGGYSFGPLDERL